MDAQLVDLKDMHLAEDKVAQWEIETVDQWAKKLVELTVELMVARVL